MTPAPRGSFGHPFFEGHPFRIPAKALLPRPAPPVFGWGRGVCPGVVAGADVVPGQAPPGDRTRREVVEKLDGLRSLNADGLVMGNNIRVGELFDPYDRVVISTKNKSSAAS